MLAQPVDELLADLAAGFDAAAAVDPGGLSSGALVAGLDELLTLESRLRALQCRWLAAADDVDATVERCGRTVRAWLVEEQRLNPGDAGRRMRLARSLPIRAAIAAAFDAGEITAEHASVIVAALLSMPGWVRDAAETALVDLAREHPPFLVARTVDDVLTALGVDKDSDAARERRYSRRRVSVAETFGGTGSLAGTLTPEVTETLRVALRAAADRGGAVGGGEPDDRSAAQRHHDALGEIAGFYLAHAALPDNAGERPRVVVTIDLDTLLDRLGQRWAALDSGVTVSPATARRLACDAEIIPAVLGSRGEVLDIGVATRTWTAAIRRAAKLRDGARCTYPRCTRPIRELHHIVWWSNGGTSCLDNAAWLCAFHHWLVHEGKWTMRREPDGRYTFTSPDGRDHRTPRHPEAA